MPSCSESLMVNLKHIIVSVLCFGILGIVLAELCARSGAWKFKYSSHQCTVQTYRPQKVLHIDLHM